MAEEDILIQSVDKNNGGWLVSVEIGQDSSDSTTHDVTIDEEYYEYLTGGGYSVETLIDETFKFLLQRESRESILRNFDIHEVTNYFPDYEDAVTEQLMQM